MCQIHLSWRLRLRRFEEFRSPCTLGIGTLFLRSYRRPMLAGSRCVRQKPSRPAKVPSHCSDVVEADTEETERLTARYVRAVSTDGRTSELTLAKSDVPCVPPYATSCSITEHPVSSSHY
jgi:hypothetical protein